jgi:hypothetical protein
VPRSKGQYRYLTYDEVPESRRAKKKGRIKRPFFLIRLVNDGRRFGSGFFFRTLHQGSEQCEPFLDLVIFVHQAIAQHLGQLPPQVSWWHRKTDAQRRLNPFQLACQLGGIDHWFRCRGVRIKFHSVLPWVEARLNLCYA